MTYKKTAVLIHGCHLQAELGDRVWEDIVFGSMEPSNISLQGRAVMGVKIAIENEAEKIIFGTGASSRGEVVESIFTQQETLRQLPEIIRFLEKKLSLENLKSLLRDAELDCLSRNTDEESFNAVKFCIDNGFDRLILVSSPWHIARCHVKTLEAANALIQTGSDTLEILAISSYGSTEEIAISEPPHRGDRSKIKIHKLVRRADSLGRNQKTCEGFSLELELLLGKWEKIKISNQ